MKKICLLLVLCLCLSACSAFAEETADASALTEQAQDALKTEDYEIYTGNDGEQYDLFEIRKLFYDENHKVYAVSGVYERVALDDDCYYGKIAEDGAFTYDLAPDFQAMMIDPETWDPLGPFLPVTDIYTWYIDAYRGGEAPESGELVFRYDLPEDEQETAEVDFWFITTRIRLNDRRQIEYMQYYYVPWA